MSQLLLQIELARSIFTARALEQRPSKVLLGRYQMHELLEIAKEAGWVSPNTIELDAKFGENRLEYRGLEVYPVDDEQYCEVCS